MSPAIAFLICPVIFLASFITETEGNPVILTGQLRLKPPKCPHGQCFLDRCIRICSCEPPEGSTSCTKSLLSRSMECSEKGTDNCPLGQTYRSAVWKDNFLCYCNNDASQTYECFDLSKQTSADVRELLTIRNNSKAHEIIGTGGKGVPKVPFKN